MSGNGTFVARVRLGAHGVRKLARRAELVGDDHVPLRGGQRRAGARDDIVAVDGDGRAAAERKCG
jgi:hypothetical protein